MNIEKEIFKKSKVIISKLEDYGFQKKKEDYIYQKSFMNNEFEAIIKVSKNGTITGKVMDLEVEEEYINIRTEITGEFARKIKEAYQTILMDIKDHCCETSFFIGDQANRITKSIIQKYQTSPEFLWKKTPDCAVFRNSKNKKWFGIIMNIKKSKLDSGEENVDIINIKLNRQKIEELLLENGFYRAYHMNKKDWITIILNNTLKDHKIMNLIDESYNLINNK